MINFDVSDSNFLTQLENIISYYKNILKSELTSELESRASENLSNLNSFIDETKSSNQLLDNDEKIETLYLELKELLEVYQLAGKDDQLDFNEEDLSRLINEPSEDSDDFIED